MVWSMSYIVIVITCVIACYKVICIFKFHLCCFDWLITIPIVIYKHNFNPILLYKNIQISK